MNETRTETCRPCDGHGREDYDVCQHCGGHGFTITYPTAPPASFWALVEQHEAETLADELDPFHGPHAPSHSAALAWLADAGL